MSMPNFPFPLPVTQAALYASALSVLEAWIAAAEQAPAAYRAGLLADKSIVYPADGDVLAARVVNVASSAWRLEMGQPAFHLSSVIRWPTPKSHRSKRGTFYIIIPMGHATRGIRPRKVYAVARQLQPGQRLTAGPTTGRAVHASGLQPYQPRNPLNVRPGQQASMYEGIQRTPKGRGGTYATFRVITPSSPGWHIPARPGVHLIAHVIREVTPQVTRMIEAAVKQDVVAAVQQRWGG